MNEDAEGQSGNPVPANARKKQVRKRKIKAPKKPGDKRGKHPAFEAQKWKKGQSGNPAGKAPGTLSIIGRIKTFFENNPEDFEAYLHGIIKDPFMRRHVMQQVDGMPRQPVDVTFPKTLVDLIKSPNETPNETGSGDVPTENQGQP